MTTRFQPIAPIALTVLALSCATIFLLGSMAMDVNSLSAFFNSILMIMAAQCVCICFSHLSAVHAKDLLMPYLVLDNFVLAAVALLVPREEGRKSIDFVLTPTPVSFLPELSLSPLQINGPFSSSVIGVISAVVMDREEGVRRKRLHTIVFAFHVCAGVTLLPSAVYSAHGYEAAAKLLYTIVLYVTLWRVLAFAGTALVLAELRRRRRDGAASGKPASQATGQELEGGGAEPSTDPDSRTTPHPLLPVLQALPVPVAVPLVPMDHVSQAGAQVEAPAEFPVSLQSIEPGCLREAILRNVARHEGVSRRRSNEGSVESGWVSTSPSQSSEGDAAFLAEHEGAVFGEDDESLAAHRRPRQAAASEQ